MFNYKVEVKKIGISAFELYEECGCLIIFDEIAPEELAEIANMSPASLHRYFKDVTTMSPIQFQKQVRLQEARRLLLSEPTDATDVAFRVGYESPSQFSREYSRLFGFPPIEDIKNLKNGALNNKFRLCSI